MPHRPDERTRHTRLGWWIMTHDRGSSAVIGGISLALFLADLVYLASRWHGLHDAFDRGFLLGFVWTVFVGLSTKALGLEKPIGPDRRKAQARARIANLVGFVFIGIVIAASNWLGGHALIGAFLGAVAALSSGFALFTALWVARGGTVRQSA